MPVPHRLHDLELLVPANGMEGQCHKQTFKLMKKYLGLHQTKCISSSSSRQQTLKSRPKKHHPKVSRKKLSKTSVPHPVKQGTDSRKLPCEPKTCKADVIKLGEFMYRPAPPPPHPSNFRIELSKLTQDRMQMSWSFQQGEGLYCAMQSNKNNIRYSSIALSHNTTKYYIWYKITNQNTRWW